MNFRVILLQILLVHKQIHVKLQLQVQQPPVFVPRHLVLAVRAWMDLHLYARVAVDVTSIRHSI